MSGCLCAGVLKTELLGDLHRLPTPALCPETVCPETRCPETLCPKTHLSVKILSFGKKILPPLFFSRKLKRVM
jgi:hypothetical protein